MSRLEERIAAAEDKLKALKARQARAESRQRARDAKQKRQDDLRRRILLGGVVLELVERGEIERSCLARWLDVALTRAEDKALFANYCLMEP
jgi:chromosome segregation ATPase